MEDFLKYLPFIAIVTAVWAIVQFFIKRRNDRKDRERDLKLSTYKELHFKTNAIKNEYLKLFALLNQAALMLRKRSKQIKGIDQGVAEEASVVDTKTISSNLQKETEKAAELLSKIESEGYDKDKHEKVVKEELAATKERKKKFEYLDGLLKSRQEELEKERAQLKEISAILNAPLTKDGVGMFSSVKDISANLQRLILELNNIPLLGIGVKEKPNSLVYNTYSSIQKTIDLIESEVKEINRDSILEVIRAEDIEEALMDISKLEEHIYRALK